MDEAQSLTWWESAIREERSKISSPPDFVAQYLKAMSISGPQIKADVEYLLLDVRDLVYQQYLEAEANLNRALMHTLLESETPIIRQQINMSFSSVPTSGIQMSRKEFEEFSLSGMAELSGSLFEYIQALSTSNTNARRARAGATFEILFATALAAFGIPFQDQNTLGNTFFKKNNLGKKVDFIVPNAETYEISRSRCAIVSAKTTLRERWQQVVEELARSNVPHIYLATLGSDVTDNMLSIMNNYNITLVVPAAIRASHPKAHNLIGFQDFFDELSIKYTKTN